jgi:hypothetical protein
VSGDYDTTFVETHARELLGPADGDQQQAQDALLLAVLAADADGISAKAGAPSAPSRWRDAVLSQVTRFR